MQIRNSDKILNSWIKKQDSEFKFINRGLENEFKILSSKFKGRISPVEFGINSNIHTIGDKVYHRSKVVTFHDGEKVTKIKKDGYWHTKSPYGISIGKFKLSDGYIYQYKKVLKDYNALVYVFTDFSGNIKHELFIA